MPKPRKPRALAPGSIISVIQASSPVESDKLKRGCDNLAEVGYHVVPSAIRKPDGFFAASRENRVSEVQSAFDAPETRGVFCSRGGYGCGELLDYVKPVRWTDRKVFCGFSDLTCLHIYLWQKLRWVTFYGPHVSSNFASGVNATGGYDPDSFMCAMTATNSGWSIGLRGESLLRGSATGTLLGGCITLITTSLGTPWELDTRGSILVLEDLNVKPYQLDRMLLHLKQAGKFKGVRGIVLGEFPGSDPPDGSNITTHDVCRRVLGPLRIPMVYGAQVGHTSRPILTVPFGIQARLYSAGEGRLDLLEPAVVP